MCLYTILRARSWTLSTFLASEALQKCHIRWQYVKYGNIEDLYKSNFASAGIRCNFEAILGINFNYYRTTTHHILPTWLKSFYQRNKLSTWGLRNGKKSNCASTVILMFKKIIPYTNSIKYSLIAMPCVSLLINQSKTWPLVHRIVLGLTETKKSLAFFAAWQPFIIANCVVYREGLRQSECRIPGCLSAWKHGSCQVRRLVDESILVCSRLFRLFWTINDKQNSKSDERDRRRTWTQTKKRKGANRMQR